MFFDPNGRESTIRTYGSQSQSPKGVASKNGFPRIPAYGLSSFFPLQSVKLGILWTSTPARALEVHFHVTHMGEKVLDLTPCDRGTLISDVLMGEQKHTANHRRSFNWFNERYFAPDITGSIH